MEADRPVCGQCSRRPAFSQRLVRKVCQGDQLLPYACPIYGTGGEFQGECEPDWLCGAYMTFIRFLIWICIWNMVTQAKELNEPLLLIIPMAFSYYIIVVKQAFKK